MTTNVSSFCRHWSGVAAAIFAILLVSDAALAQQRSLPSHVTAYSDYGNGSVTGAVRLNSKGYPVVQLPSGTWIDCEGDCADAMRRIYLDFWNILQEESGPNPKD